MKGKRPDKLKAMSTAYQWDKLPRVENLLGLSEIHNRPKAHPAIVQRKRESSPEVIRNRTSPAVNPKSDLPPSKIKNLAI